MRSNGTVDGHGEEEFAVKFDVKLHLNTVKGSSLHESFLLSEHDFSCVQYRCNVTSVNALQDCFDLLFMCCLLTCCDMIVVFGGPSELLLYVNMF